MKAQVKTALQYWGYVAPLLQPARNAKEYAQLVETLDVAVDTGGAALFDVARWPAPDRSSRIG